MEKVSNSYTREAGFASDCMVTLQGLQCLNVPFGASRGAQLITYCNLGKLMPAARFSALGDTVLPVPVSFGRSYFKA